MKFRVFLFFIFIPGISIYAKAPCSLEFVSSEKNIKKSYEKIRKISSKCTVTGKNYLDFSKRAFLSEEYSLAIWSSETGLKNCLENSGICLELNYFLGISLLKKKRPEDAIGVLRKLVFDPMWQNKEHELIQKAHLALVESYYQRGKRRDENTRYLIELFKNRYATSHYLFTLRSWNTNVN